MAAPSVRVIEPAFEPSPPLPPARRKGPAGAWQVLVDGKWLSERAVLAWQAYQLKGTRAEAALDMGIDKEAFDKHLARYTEAMGLPKAPADGAPSKPKAVQKSSERFDSGHKERPGGWSTPKPAEQVAPAAAPTPAMEPPAEPWRATVEHLFTTMVDAGERLAAVERHVSEFTKDDELPTAVYRHGYRIGWLVAALTFISGYDNVSQPNEWTIKRIVAIARKALDPADPPVYP